MGDMINDRVRTASASTGSSNSKLSSLPKSESE